MVNSSPLQVSQQRHGFLCTDISTLKCIENAPPGIFFATLLIFKCGDHLIQTTADGRVDVVSGGRRQIVAVGPDVDAGKLEAGDEVFLTGEGVVVGVAEVGLEPCGVSS